MRTDDSNSRPDYKMGKVRNTQDVKISSKDLEKPAKTEKYDSTIEERSRGYPGRKAEPRFSEYR
jgi:hypothetical protein